MIEILGASQAHTADADFLLDEYEAWLGIARRDSPEALAGYLSDPASALWIAYVDAEPAGLVLLRPLPAAGATAVECKRLYVRPRYRRQGIAAALLDTLELDAAKRGARWVYLENKDHLMDAYRVYARRGYEPCERFNTNPLATIFLRKHLYASPRRQQKPAEQAATQKLY